MVLSPSLPQKAPINLYFPVYDYFQLSVDPPFGSPFKKITLIGPEAGGWFELSTTARAKVASQESLLKRGIEEEFPLAI